MKKKIFLICNLLLVCGMIQSQTLPSYLPSNGLVAWYPFNGNANDESGNGHDSSVIDAILSIDRFSNNNSSYSFQSSIQCCPYIQTLANVNFLQNEISGSFWFKPDISYQLGVAGTFISGNSPIQIAYDNGGLIIQIWGSIGYQGFSFPTILTAGNWYNFAFSKALTGEVSLIINGVSHMLGIYNGSMSQINLGDLIFGRSQNSYWTNPFKGNIDDIAIYNRALTQEEITALYTGTPNNGGGGGSSSANPVPPGIPYQAVVRNANGGIAANAAVTSRFTLHQTTADGAVEYQETHALTTNAQGLMSTVLGQGTAVQNTFATINWANTIKFLQVEVDLGSGYVDLGTQQLMSVPYSIQSQTALTIRNTDLPVYADNAAALAGGLTTGQLYRTSTGDLKIVY
jgi:hypothetical protein